MLEQIAKKINLEMSNNSLKIGNIVKHPEGYLIKIIGGCYLNPDITSLNYTSWIALDHPYAIIFDAAATVFKSIGKDEEAAAYRNMVVEQILMIKASNVVAVGF